MFWRLVFQLLRGSRGRLAVAIVAIVSGAAVISALLSLDLGVQNKLTQEFRTLGANIVISPAQAPPTGSMEGSTPLLMDQDAVMRGIARARTAIVVAAAPFLYIIAQTADTRIVVAGTNLQEISALNPNWKIQGSLLASPGNSLPPCVVGRHAARQFHLSLDSPLHLQDRDRHQTCTVTGILDTGAAEDNQIFTDLSLVQQLSALPGQIGLAQLSVTGTPSTISAFVASLALALPQFEVRPIRQVTEAEGALLGRIKLLIVSMVLLILILTALCVLGTMAALAMERRKDVGLMKSLGGSIPRIVGIFLAEVGVLGAVGGLIGAILGIALSYWMGLRVFGTAISPRWEVFPVTIVLMILVALAGALPLRLLGKVKPAEILRGE